VDRSVDRFTGCPDISRRHRLGWHRGHKASSLNGVFLSSDCDSGIQKKEESICFIRPQQNALSVAQPVFEGGALRSQLRLTRAQYQEAVLTYQQTVQNALEQVSNGLIAYQKYRDFRGQQEMLTQASQRSDRLSMLLYQNGGSSYLQVLTNDTNYFSAELNLVQAQLNERLALVQLYLALGGGWQQ